MIKVQVKFFGVAFSAIVLMAILGGCAFKGPYRCHLGSYSGRILDRNTGEPIEGAVIHVTYSAYGASYAGSVGTQVAVRETLSDSNGEFIIPNDTVLHKCFSGNLEGWLQIFKPGYGTMGHSGYRRYCPDKGPEGDCPMETGKYMIWELPKLETWEERSHVLDRTHPAFGISNDEQNKLRKAISEERVFLGFSPLSGVKTGEIDEK